MLYECLPVLEITLSHCCWLTVEFLSNCSVIQLFNGVKKIA